jgi:WD40 repeat protein
LCAAGDEPVPVLLYDASSGKSVARFEGLRVGAYSLAFSHDGRHLASAGIDRVVHMWDVHSQKLIGEHKVTGAPKQLRWSPDDKSLAVVAEDHVLVWEGEQDKPADFRAFGLSALVWSADGATLATGSAYGAIQLWTAGAWKSPSVLSDGGAIAFFDVWSRDGAMLDLVLAPATQRYQTSIAVLDVAAGRLIKAFATADASEAQLCVSPDGQTAAAARVDTLKRIDLRTTKVMTLANVKPEAVATAWSPAGDEIAVAHVDHKVRVWDAGTGELRRTLDGTVASGYQWAAIAWSCDGLLATGSLEGAIQIWDAAGKLKRELRGTEEDDHDLKRLVWSPDGGRLLVASSGRDNRASIWDVGTGSRLLKFAGVGLGWSRDGQAILCGAALGEQGYDVVDAQTG